MSEGFGRRLRSHPVAGAALLYALLSALLFAPGLLPHHTTSGSGFLWSSTPWSASRPAGVPPGGPNSDLTDAFNVFQPFLQHTRATLPHVPLWDPNIMGGRPFLADAQSAVFSPFSLPAYVLPFWWSLSLIAFLKVFVAAFGAFLLARALGLRYAGALLTGLVFAFSLWFVIWVAWPLTSVWSLLPWLLLMTDRLVRRPGPLSAAGLAAVAGAQFLSGHPESSFYAVVAAVAFFALRLVQTRREGSPQRPARTLACFAGGIAVGGALGAVAIIPFVELLANSADLGRGGVGPNEGFDRKYAFGLLLYDYWGRPTQTQLVGLEFTRALYVGALPLMLAMAALVHRRNLIRVAFAGTAAFTLLVILRVPPVFQALTALPAFHVLHNSRLAILLVLSLALLAGWGLDDLMGARLTRRQATTVVLLGAVLVIGPAIGVLTGHRASLRTAGRAFEVAWEFAHPPPRVSAEAASIVRLSALVLWSSFALVAMGLLVARLRGRVPAGAFAGLALVLVAGDLFRAGMGQNPAASSVRATQPVTGAILYLQSHRPNRFVGPPGKSGPPPIPPDVALRYGLYDARGYDFPVIDRYDRVWRRYVTGPDFFPTGPYLAKVNDRSLPILDLFGVRDIIQRRRQLAPFGPRVRLAYDGPDAQIYDNGRALPRAFLPAAQTVVANDDAALEQIGRRDFDGVRNVISDHPLPELPLASGSGGTSGGTARIAKYEPERVVIDVRALRRAELVLSDLSYPGWQATVDGQRRRVDRVDYLFRGVPVDGGHHTVEFRYRPGSWTAGRVITLLGVLALLGALGVGLRTTRLRAWNRPVRDDRPKRGA